MNKFCYPGTEKSDKAGFQKHHQLVKATKNETAIQSEKKIRESLPTDWMYNDNKAKEVWDELEFFSTREDTPMMTDEQNPFSKIDDSAAKIRNTINDFEAHDQEFLLELMDLVGDDSYADSISGDSILFEARCRLQQMIEEHIDFGERQTSLLQNLTSWFVEAKKREENELTTIQSLKDTSFSQDKIEELKELIQSYISNTSSSLEKAEIIHQDLVQNLNERVQECQKTISQKDMQITQMNQTLSQQNSRKRSPNNFVNVRNGVNYDSTLANSQKKVMELENQLNSLKSTLGNQTKIQETTSIDQIQTENENDEGGIISVEKEVEFESKLAILTTQIKNLKTDNKNLQEQILQVRQNEIMTEKKLNSMERQKKTLESSLLTANKKLETVKQQLDQKSIEKTEEIDQINSHDNELEIRKMYESKIDQMNEEYRKQVNSIQDALDKKYRNQLKDLMVTCNADGGSIKALEQITANYQQQMLEYEKKNMNDLKDEKRRTAEKLQNIAKHYEKLISKKELEMEKIKKSNENSQQNLLNEFKIDYEDQVNSQKLEEHEKMINELSDIKMNMELNFNQLKEKFTLMKRERDSLKELIDVDTLADLNLIEEEDFNDEVFQNSMFELKQKEIEEKLGEKFGNELKQQKEILENTKNWEIDNAKNFFINRYQKVIDDLRKSVVDSLNEANEQIKSEELDMTDFVNMFLNNTLKLIESNTETEILESFNNPTIPLFDVDKKVNELNNQILTLKSENELWRKTYERLDNDPSQKNKLDTMKKIVEEQSKKMAEIQKESKLLQDKLNRLHAPQLAQLEQMDQQKLVINEPLSYDIINEFEESPKETSITKNTQNQNEVIYNNDESIEIEINKQNNICSKCKNQINENEFIDEIIECKISICPNCNHTSVFVQTDDFIKNKIVKELENSLNANLDLSLPTIPNGFAEISIETSARLNQTDKSEMSTEAQLNEIHKAERSTETSARLNEIRKAERSTETSARLYQIDKAERSTETSARFNEFDKFERSSTGTNKSEIQLQLDEAIEKNQKLKEQLTKYQNHFKDLEKQYLLRIDNMKAEMMKYQKNFLNDSIEMVERARNLEDEGEKNLTQKVQVSQKVAKTIDDIDFPKKTITRSLSQKFIDYTQKNLKDVCSFETANNALDQAKTVLTHIKDDTIDYISEKSFKKSSNIFKSVRDEISELKNFMTHFVSEMKHSLKNMKSQFQGFNAPGQALLEKVYQLQEALKKRTEQLNFTNQKLLKQQEKFDSIQEQFRETISQLEQLQIHTKCQSDEADLLKKDELKNKDTISHLTQQVISNQDDIREKEKEIEQLKLNLIHLESENLILSQQIFNPNMKFDLTPSFVIYSTDLQLNKGFSLMPSIELKQSEPLSIDQTTSQSCAPTDILKKGVEGKKMQTPSVIEKVRIKYIQSNYPNQLSKSSCKVIIPQPKSSKYSKSKTIDKEQSRLDSNRKIERDLSFDNLVPVNLDNTGSLIGYVTRYIPKGEMEKQKIKLEQSGILISEVPAEKLKLDEPNSNESQDANSFQSQESNKIQNDANSLNKYSMQIQESIHTEASSIDNLSRPISQFSSIRSQLDFEVTKSEWINRFNKRVRFLENKLRDTIEQLKQERDKSHQAYQSLFKMNTELRTNQRMNKKLNLLHESTKNRLQQALSIINKNDIEISRLKKLLSEFNSIAINKEIEYNKQNSEMVTQFRSIECTLSNQMVEEEIRSMRRWIPKRDKYIEDERNRLLLALKALRLVNNDQEITVKNSFQVTPIKKKVVKQHPIEKTKIEPLPSYEKAIKNMNESSFSKSLNKGVVGRPMTCQTPKRLSNNNLD